MDQARRDGACSRQNNATAELLTTPRNNITNMSLFGNLGGNQPAGSAAPASSSTFGSLFGSKPATTSAAPASGLFGSLGGATSNTTQPASSGGFGGSLFGSALGAKPAASPAPASGPTGGLFGGAAAQPQTQTSSLFGGLGGATANQPSNPTQPSGIGASSLFGATSTQQPQQQQQQQQGASLAQANAGTGRSAHFDHLLERGRKRNAGENGLTGFDELPSLQLGLGDIARKVRNLGAGGPSAAQAQDGQQDRAA